MVSRILTLDAPCIAAAARADSLQRGERTQSCRLVSVVRQLVRPHRSRCHARAQLLLRGRARRRHRTHELDGGCPSGVVPTVGANHIRVDPCGCGFDMRPSGATQPPVDRTSPRSSSRRRSRRIEMHRLKNFKIRTEFDQRPLYRALYLICVRILKFDGG